MADVIIKPGGNTFRVTPDGNQGLDVTLYSEVNGYVGITDFAVAAVAIGTAQVELKAGTARMDGRRQLVIFPPASGTIYYGKTGVTVDTGIPLAAGQPERYLDFAPGIDIGIFAITASGSTTAKVVEGK